MLEDKKPLPLKGAPMDKKKMGAKKLLMIIPAFAVIIAIVVVLVFNHNNSKYSASTMRLLRTQGVVKLMDKGVEKTIIDNLRLSNGNALTTSVESLCSIALDDTKIVTMNDLTKVLFQQSGKELKIDLEEGSIFFEVTQKLAADETFDIRTSTMVVGIRGTSGYVEAGKNNADSSLIITDGHVIVRATNPKNGDVVEIPVDAGEQITIHIDETKESDSITYEKKKVTEADLTQEILDRLVENEELMAKVCDDTGWSIELIEETASLAMVDDEEVALAAEIPMGYEDPIGPGGTPVKVEVTEDAPADIQIEEADPLLVEGDDNSDTISDRFGIVSNEQQVVNVAPDEPAGLTPDQQTTAAAQEAPTEDDEARKKALLAEWEEFHRLVTGQQDIPAQDPDPQPASDPDTGQTSDSEAGSAPQQASSPAPQTQDGTVADNTSASQTPPESSTSALEPQTSTQEVENQDEPQNVKDDSFIEEPDDNWNDNPDDGYIDEDYDQWQDDNNDDGLIDDDYDQWQDGNYDDGYQDEGYDQWQDENYQPKDDEFTDPNGISEQEGSDSGISEPDTTGRDGTAGIPDSANTGDGTTYTPDSTSGDGTSGTPETTGGNSSTGGDSSSGGTTTSDGGSGDGTQYNDDGKPIYPDGEPYSDPNGTDPNGTDPSGTDPNGTDPSGTDPSGTDPNGTDPSGTDPSGTDPSGTNPSGTDPNGTDPSGADPSNTDPSDP